MQMVITFHPQRSDAPLTLVKCHRSLTINGQDFDFSGLLEGAYLPPEALASDAFAGPVRRENNVLHVPLFLPHGPDSGDARRFPQRLVTNANGRITPPADNRGR